MSIQSTRRGILGAMAVAPMVIAAPAALAQSGRSQWEVRVREWRAYDAYFNAHIDTEPDDPRSPEHEAWDEKSAVIGDRHENMLRALMAEPAPDSESFREKVAIYQKQYEPRDYDPIVSVLNDAVRLAEKGR